MAKTDVVCPCCTRTQNVIRHERSAGDAQLYRCKHCLKTFPLGYLYNGAKPDTYKTIIDRAINGFGCRGTDSVLGISLNTVLRHLNTHANSVTQTAWKSAEAVIQTSHAVENVSNLMSKIISEIQLTIEPIIVSVGYTDDVSSPLRDKCDDRIIFIVPQNEGVYWTENIFNRVMADKSCSLSAKLLAF